MLFFVLVVIILLSLYLSLLCFGFWLRHETHFDETADVAIVMGYCHPIIKVNGFRSVIIIQQEFSQVRGYLTARKQLADLSLKLINQPASAQPYWNKWTWMFHRIGWRYTWATVSRLIRYRRSGFL